MRKEDVWPKAEAIGLPADEVKESQEICFVTKGDYRSFLEEQAPQAARPGPFVGTDGTVLGMHRGVPFYTPGQRRGLGLAAAQRLYVVRVNAASNTDRKSTRLNSSHLVISYAVFCLKKKKKTKIDNELSQVSSSFCVTMRRCCGSMSA